MDIVEKLRATQIGCAMSIHEVSYANALLTEAAVKLEQMQKEADGAWVYHDKGTLKSFDPRCEYEYEADGHWLFSLGSGTWQPTELDMYRSRPKGKDTG